MVRHAAGKFASLLALSVSGLLVVTTPAAAESAPAAAGGSALAVSKVPVMTGSGGAVASVDADATPRRHRSLRNHGLSMPYFSFSSSIGG